MLVLKCQDLCLGYGGVKVIDGLSFNVKKGDYLSIVGENGVGKSTLVKALLGIIPTLHGSIEFGEGVSHSKIGYLPQQSEAQRDFPASVFEVVRSGCLGKKGFNPFYTKNDNARALHYIGMLELVDIKDKCYRELSGGQQQRVLLARALCSTEELILLDEPVSGLDAIVEAEFYSLISKLNKKGVTVIMVSHDIQSAIKYSSHVLHVKKNGSYFAEVSEYKKSESFKNLTGEDC